MEQLSLFPHGRANHEEHSPSPQCLCGAAGVKDVMWDRFYCPIDGIWLEGCWTQCWCKDCLIKIKAEWANNNPYDPDHPTDGLDYVTNPVNEWLK